MIIFHNKCKERLSDMNFYDPMIVVLEKLKAEFDAIKGVANGKSLAGTLEQSQDKS